MRSRALLIAALLVAVGGVVWLMSQKFAGSSATPEDSTRGSHPETKVAGRRAPTLEGTGDGAPEPRADDEDEPAKLAPFRVTVVRDSDDQPIEGATVVAIGDWGTPTGRTNERGQATLDDMFEGEWTFTAFHPMYVAVADSAPSEDRPIPTGTGYVRRTLSTDAASRAVIVRLTPGRRVDGSVLNPDGSAARDAAVHIRSPRYWRWLNTHASVSRSKRGPYLSVQCDEDGRFALACVPAWAGTFQLGAYRPDHACRWSRALSSAADSAPVHVRLQLVHGATISGSVLVPDGSPADGAYVEVEDDAGAAGVWLYSDPLDPAHGIDCDVGPRGTYQLKGLPPGDFAVSADWYAPYLEGNTLAVEGLAAGEVRRGVDFALPRRYTLEVRLVNEAQRPLRGQRLSLQRADAPAAPEVAEETTDEEGRAQFGAASPGPFNLLHLKPGAAVTLAKDIVLPTDSLVFLATPPEIREVTVEVTRRDGKKPYSVKSILRSVATDDWEFDSEIVTRGRPAVHHVKGPPPYSLRVYARMKSSEAPRLQSHRSTIHTIPADGVVRVQLDAEGTVAGQVVNINGAPVGDVRMWIVVHHTEREPTHIDIPVSPDGRFDTLLPAEAYEDGYMRLHLRVPSGYFAPPPSRYREGQRVGTIVLPPGGAIAGEVQMPKGFDPGDGQWIRVEWDERDDDPNSMEPPITAPINAGGSFDVSGVPIDRPLRVGLLEDLARKHGVIPAPPLTGVRAGDTDIRLELKTGLEIQGRMKVPAGVRISRAFVAAFPIEGQATRNLGEVDAEGLFRVRGLSPGRYRLELVGQPGDEHDDFAVLQEQVATAGQDDVTLRVPPLGSIHIAFDGPGTKQPDWSFITVQALATDTLQLTSGSTPNWKGTEVAGLPAGGRFYLVMSDGEEFVGTSPPVSVGERATMKVVRGKPLAGRIIGLESPDDAYLYARSEKGLFSLALWDDGTFNEVVAPGVLEIVLRRLDGSVTIVARNVKAGTEDLVIKVK